MAASNRAYVRWTLTADPQTVAGTLVQGRERNPLNVGFAGHRRWLEVGSSAHVRRILRSVFRALHRERSKLVLWVGPAEGADKIARLAWLDERAGPSVLLKPEEAGGHEAQARLLLNCSDILIVLWNGSRGRGPGGTGDTVRRALERGVPVLWIEPRGGRLRFRGRMRTKSGRA